jgi:hypothetical protein
LIAELERGGIGSQDRDRLMRRRSALLPLTWEQACRLAAVRMDSLPELREERQNHPDPLWPLNIQVLKDRFPGDGSLVARKVIVFCSDLFEEWRSGSSPSPSVTSEDFLENNLQSRLQATPVEKSDTVLRAGLPSLFRLRGLGYEAAEPQRFVSLEGIIRGSVPMAVAVCNQNTQGGALARRLEKLQKEWPQEVPFLAIFRDARKGIGHSAAATQERLTALRKRGAQLVSVEPEALSALNAINELLADARSGDLALRGDVLSPATVESWLASHLPAPLEDLMDGVSGASTTDTVSALAAFLEEARVVRLEEAARQLEISVEEVEAVARRHPALFGVAGGNTCVLYRVISEARAE